MRYIGRIILYCFLAVLGAGIQVSIIAPIAPMLPFDLIILGAFTLVIHKRLPEALLFALVGGLTLDTMAGWHLPAHMILNMAATMLFYLLSIRIFSSQTPASASTNAFLVTAVIGVMQALAAGLAFVSLPEQSLSFSGVWVTTMLRATIVALAIGTMQIFRRRSYVQVDMRHA